MFNGNKFKDVTVRGRTFRVQGHEGLVIQWLVDSKDVDVNEINVWTSGLVPEIVYRFKGRLRSHKPDLLVRGTVIEVKSPYTLGLLPGIGVDENWLGKHKAMAKAAFEKGLTYRVVVVNGSVVVLPKKWYTLGIRQIRNLVA